MAAHGVVYLSVALASTVGLSAVLLVLLLRQRAQMQSFAVGFVQLVEFHSSRLEESRSLESKARDSALNATRALQESQRDNQELVQENNRLRLRAEESEAALADVTQVLEEKSKTVGDLEERSNDLQVKYESTASVAERYLNSWAESAGEAEEYKILYEYFEGEAFAARKERRAANDLMIEERAKETRASVVQDTLLHGAAAVVGG
jgi:DNA repair exonuclease SbcCD ATPase subunit